MKKCLIHIGMEKTGSTSIQRLLGQSSAMLREAGICYPLAALTGVELALPIRHDQAATERLRAQTGLDIVANFDQDPCGKLLTDVRLSRWVNLETRLAFLFRHLSGRSETLDAGVST